MTLSRSLGRASSRSESVVVVLRNMILYGEFSAGFHLQEIPLAERMGVSRTPIREALAMLAKEGLLAPGPKRGYKVRTFSITEIMEAYDIRATLEGMACRVLAERGLASETVRMIRKCLELGDRMLEGGMFTELHQDGWLEMNNAFHTGLVTATGNSMLANLVEQSQRVPLASARHVHWYRLDRENFELARSAHRDHHEIFEAIMQRQAGRAEARMREHIYFSQDIVRQYFKQQSIGFDAVVAQQRRPSRPESE